jgi:hypothetical protein
MWRFPGVLLWLPTAVNAFLGAEILRFAWEARHGYNMAQGDMQIAGHILVGSVPLSALLLLGWAILAVLRIKVPPSPELRREPGVRALALVNIVAPVLLVLEFVCVA